MSVPALVTVTLPNINAMPEDAVVNTFTFAPDDLTSTHQTTLFNAVRDFYNVAHGTSTQPIGTYLSPDLDRGTGKATVRIYDLTGHLDGSPHGSPIVELPMTLHAGGSGGYALANQLAGVLSFHGDFTGHPESIPGGPAGPAGDTKPRARRRGRLYLGPIADLATAEESGFNSPRLNAPFRGTCTDAAAWLMGGADRWSVWSRADAEVYPVVGGFMDNRIDTQRRRAVKASVRTTFGV
jgi:hypothetical protein